MNIDKNFRPKTLTLITATIIVVALSIIYILVNFLLYSEINFLPLVISDIIVFLVSFFVYNYIIEKFIYAKIKLIYKTIHTFKTPKGSKNKELDLNKDIISSVNQDVLNWAQDRKDEIEELKKLETYRREFLGNVSHELKTPLFNIQGYILTLLDGGLEDVTINKEYLLKTEKNIDRMVAIVEDLESISRFESGELQLELTKFDLVLLAKEVVDFLEIKAKKKNIRIHFRQDYEKPIYVYADKEKIRQVLINLIDNSIKYNNDNGKTKVSFFDMDENELIEITDNGIGIETKDISRLFERFFRVDKSRSRGQGGSGLGLAIVKHIIEAHNQTINVRSTIGVGTTFAFTLKKSNNY